VGIENFSTENWVTGSGVQENSSASIAAGQDLLERVPLGQNTITGDFHEWAPAANDGTEKAVYLTAFAVDTTSGIADKQVTKAGTFNPELVNWPAGTTAVQMKLAFVGSPISLQTPR